MVSLQTLEIPTHDGLLEALLRLPDSGRVAPAMAAVVCHPHPLAGGTLHNKVVFLIAQALGDIGLTVIRSYFRAL